MTKPRLVLASASPRRRDLLAQIGLSVDRIAPADIDETPQPKESARDLSLRLAIGKCQAVPSADLEYVIAADTVVAVGRRILPKAETRQEALSCIKLLSGRAHRVFTGICVRAPDERLSSRVVESRVRMKRFSDEEMESYLEYGDWQGKAGGYAIQGLAGGYILGISGSYTSIVGLPLYETRMSLAGLGFPVNAGLVNG